MDHHLLGRLVAIGAASAVLLVGCDHAAEVSGQVVTADGRPVQGATVMIDSMEYTSRILATTAEDGTYRARIAPDAAASNFEVEAWFETQYNGAIWRLPLEPQGPATTWGEDGLSLDFVMRTHGPGHWTTYDPDQPASRHGLVVGVEVYDQNLGDGWSQAMDLPEGATIEVTFMPSGPLIDGSTIAPFSRELKLERATSRTNPFAGKIEDVPIGTYTVTAAVTSPTAMPLRVGSSCSSTAPGHCPYPNDPLAASNQLRVYPRSSHSVPYQGNAAADITLHVLP